MLLGGAHSWDPLPGLFQEQVNTVINLGFNLEGSGEPTCPVHWVYMLIPPSSGEKFLNWCKDFFCPSESVERRNSRGGLCLFVCPVSQGLSCLHSLSTQNSAWQTAGAQAGTGCTRAQGSGRRGFRDTNLGADPSCFLNCFITPDRVTSFRRQGEQYLPSRVVGPNENYTGKWFLIAMSIKF